jgi:hypothetical protein
MGDSSVVTTVDPTFSTGPSFPAISSAAQYQQPVFNGSNAGCPWYCVGALLGSPTDMFGACEACFCNGPTYVYDEDTSVCYLASVEASAQAAGAAAAAQTPPVDCTQWYNQLFSSSCGTFNLTPWLIGAAVVLGVILLLPMLEGSSRRRR